jgi:hypothetical protein
LLACGVLSSLLYVATDALGAMRREGYSYVSQTVSELSAIGAPTRPLVGALFLAYSVLEAKGDFCSQVRSMLYRTERDTNYVEAARHSRLLQPAAQRP